jgi:hypothetical protein
MTKVAVIYVAATKHILACFTIASGDIDPKAKVTDFVGSFVPLRDPKGNGQIVFFPSKDELKLAVIDVSSPTVLAKVLTTPTSYSVKDPDKNPDLLDNDSEIPAVDTAPPPLPPNGIRFKLPNGAPGKPLACLIAAQFVTPPGADDPARTGPADDKWDASSATKTVAFDVAGSHYVLLVEGRMPLIA